MAGTFNGYSSDTNEAGLSNGNGKKKKTRGKMMMADILASMFGGQKKEKTPIDIPSLSPTVFSPRRTR